MNPYVPYSPFYCKKVLNKVLNKSEVIKFRTPRPPDSYNAFSYFGTFTGPLDICNDARYGDFFIDSTNIPECGTDGFF
jgi:hypothetical protein